MKARKIGKAFLSFVGLVFAPATFATDISLPRHSPVPGGIAVVPLVLTGDTQPAVYFGSERVLVTRSEAGWQAIVGIPLDVQPGMHSLAITTQDGRVEQLFQVEPKDYPVQRLTVRNKNHVEPSAEELARIQAEQSALRKAFATWNESLVPDLRFDVPVRGRLSSTFGLKRYFNEQPRKPHSGLDVAIAEGTPVIAPASGVVIETGDFFFNGNTILIDHGQGVVSMYCHLRKVDVVAGQLVARGDKLGEVGMSGRATGPHLHWTVSLNNSSVDPLLFLDAERFSVPNPLPPVVQPVATTKPSPPSSP